MLSNKKHQSTVRELFIIVGKLLISFVFIIKSYIAVLKNVRLNSTHYFFMKIPNTQEPQQIAINPLYDIDFQDFIFMKDVLQSHFFHILFFLVHHTTLASNNSKKERI